MDVKPGYKSTEFLMSIAGLVISVLVSLGYLRPQDSSIVLGSLGDAITSAGTLVASAWIVTRYITARTDVKTMPENVTVEVSPPKEVK